MMKNHNTAYRLEDKVAKSKVASQEASHATSPSVQQMGLYIAELADNPRQLVSEVESESISLGVIETQKQQRCLLPTLNTPLIRGGRLK
jgi:hypothetical protein